MSIDFRADLHCHSTCSDGTLSPNELVVLAKETGLSGLCITDHDTIESYPEVFKKAEEIGIEMIPGIEFSTVLLGESVHILGYSFAIDHDEIRNLCLQHVDRRRNRNEEILELLKKNGMPIHLDLEGKPKGRPHIAQAMVEAGYIDSVAQAFKKWIGDQKPCYSKGTSISTEETIRVIHEAGGIAVIAHPHLLRHNWIIPRLLELDFDGIECYYARLGMNRHQRWLDIAKEKGLLVTGGSDFHGAIKPNIPLGCSWVNEETFRILQERYQSQSD